MTKTGRRALGALAVGAVTALAAGCGATGPSAPSSPSGSSFDAAAARATLRATGPLLSVGAGSLGYRVVLAPGRPGVEGNIDRSDRRITLFMQATEAPHRVAHDLAHEIGHAFDFERMTNADRRAYLARRGRPDAPWWPKAASDYGVGAGDFAEVFALCHAASPIFRSRLAPRPADACAVLPAAARAKMSASEGI
ncbi:MAG: hypothetical protein QOJ82_2132 [Solirubrobacteraceae bacterium]|nr:hypothetical protein [Solirubrobacteraceae bacterium]MEA2394241.1 hypothetical protein [Solirubrobacteraceae bacterium]